MQAADELTSASMAAHSGAEDDVPPTVAQPLPPLATLKTVTAPVNSSAWADTSGTTRHGVVALAPATVFWQKFCG